MTWWGGIGDEGLPQQTAQNLLPSHKPLLAFTVTLLYCCCLQHLRSDPKYRYSVLGHLTTKNISPVQRHAPRLDPRAAPNRHTNTYTPAVPGPVKQWLQPGTCPTKHRRRSNETHGCFRPYLSFTLSFFPMHTFPEVPQAKPFQVLGTNLSYLALKTCSGLFQTQVKSFVGLEQSAHTDHLYLLHVLQYQVFLHARHLWNTRCSSNVVGTCGFYHVIKSVLCLPSNSLPSHLG